MGLWREQTHKLAGGKAESQAAMTQCHTAVLIIICRVVKCGEER